MSNMKTPHHNYEFYGKILKSLHLCILGPWGHGTSALLGSVAPKVSQGVGQWYLCQGPKCISTTWRNTYYGARKYTKQTSPRGSKYPNKYPNTIPWMGFWDRSAKILGTWGPFCASWSPWARISARVYTFWRAPVHTACQTQKGTTNISKAALTLRRRMAQQSHTIWFLVPKAVK